MYKLSKILNEIKIISNKFPIKGRLYSLNFWGKDHDQWSPQVWKFIDFIEPNERQKKLYPEKKIILKFQNYISGNHYEDYYDINSFKWWREELNEIKIVPQPRKLKAFQNPSGVIYLIFNGKNNNSTLKNYINEIGWLHKKTNQVEFEISPYSIEQFLKLLKQLRIPYTDLSQEQYTNHIIGIDYNLFNIKKTNKWDLYDDDVEKEKWFNFNRVLDEIKIERKIKDFPGYKYNDSARKLYFKLIPYFQKLELYLSKTNLVRLIIILPNRKLNLGESEKRFFIYEDWKGNGYESHKSNMTFDELVNYTIKTYSEK